MAERAYELSLPQEKLTKGKAVWGRILSMAKYLPVAVGVGVIGRLAISPEIGRNAGISSLAVGNIYGLVSGENQKEGMRFGTVAASLVGGAGTVALTIVHGPEAGGILTFVEGSACFMLSYANIWWKAQEGKGS